MNTTISRDLLRRTNVGGRPRRLATSPCRPTDWRAAARVGEAIGKIGRARARIRSIDLYVLVITGLAACIALTSLGNETPLPWDRLALLVVLCGGAQLLQVGIESGTVSASVAVTFAAALGYGPVGFTLVTLGGSLVHACFPRRRPMQKSVFNWASWLLAGALAWWVFHRLGGQVPPARLGADSLPAALAAVVYFVIVLPVKHLQERRKRGQEPGPSEPTDVELLTEIRDLLRAQAQRDNGRG